MAGKVRNIDLAVDKDGNSRGFAVIEYDHPVEAVQVTLQKRKTSRKQFFMVVVTFGRLTRPVGDNSKAYNTQRYSETNF